MFVTSLALVGCNSSDVAYDPGAAAKTDNPLGFSVSNSFDWNTLQKVNVTVKTGGNYSKYGIELFDENPAGNSNANQLAQGSATSTTNFTANIEVGKAQQYIFARETTPDGAKLVRCAAISGSSATVDFSAKAQAVSYAKTRSITTSLSGITWPSAPVSSDYKTSIPSGVKSFSEYKDDGSVTTGTYYVDNSTTSVSAGSANNLTLYITGNVNLNYGNGNSSSTRTIYILPNATLNLTNDVDFIGTTIYIAEGGTLSGSSISAGHTSTKIYNAGTINASTYLEANNEGLIYNQGTISVPSGEVSVENDASTIVNDGTITTLNINTKGSGNFANSGIVTVTNKTDLSSNNNVWVNDGQWTTQTFTQESGSQYVINSCRLTVTGDMTLDYANNNGQYLFINNNSSSVIIGGNLNITNAGLNLLSNSIFKVSGETNIGGSSGYGIIINGTGDSNALLLQNKLTFGYQTTTLKGNLFVAYDNLSNINNQYNKYYDVATTVTMVNNTTNAGISIAKNGNCSDGYNPQTTPTDPTTYYSTSISHIYAMEDNWPDYGDYDLNDVIVKVDVKATSEQTTTPSSSADKIYKKITVTPTFMATGADNALGAYLQFDNINKSNVSSNNVESGQDKAVVQLTDNVSTLLTGNYINVGESSTRSTSNYKTGTVTTITLSSPVSQDDIENGLNFFVTVNGNNNGRKEIHLDGYNASNLAGQFSGKYFSGTNIYKAAETNLVWGVCLPGGATYNWPIERTSIASINSSFVNWCKNNGTTDTDWYNK